MSPIRDNTSAEDRAEPQTGRISSSPQARQPCALTSDEMVRARLFCIQAGAEIEAISLDRAVHDRRDPARLTEQLTTIQREAKRARARGIYRSAQDVLEILQRRGEPDWAKVDRSLFVLTRLVEQYHAGLEDVERQIASMPDDHHEMGVNPSTTLTYEATRETLTGLLPHASEAEKTALERLMKAGRKDMPETTASTEAEDPFALEPLGSDMMKAAIPTQDKVEESPALKSEAQETQPNASTSLATLDTILPDLVQRLLGVAHQFGKIISVSHAVESVRVPETRLHGLQTELYEALSAKIANEMPLQGVGHLDIGAGDDCLEITGSGFLPFAMTLNASGSTTSEANTRPGWRPMITDDTEANLRAQLAALLDGGL